MSRQRMICRWAGLLVASIFLAACGQEQGAPAGESAATDSASTEATAAAADSAPVCSGGGDSKVTELLASADPKRGERLYLQCRACHSVVKGGINKVGPNLYGIFGSQAGQVEGFNYSDAVKGSGLVWSAETLDHWLEKPAECLPGNRMVFVGIRKPEDRASLIAYLQQVTGAN
jgi:cytochrome c